MIKDKSDDPDVALAATHALEIVRETLSRLSAAQEFDYGGHEMHLGDFEVCTTCSRPIAEAQAAAKALRGRADGLGDAVVKEHLELAAQLFDHEAEAATIRADFHNGQNTEPILNFLLGYIYDRHIDDSYEHSHEAGKETH